MLTRKGQKCLHQSQAVQNCPFFSLIVYVRLKLLVLYFLDILIIDNYLSLPPLFFFFLKKLQCVALLFSEATLYLKFSLGLWQALNAPCALGGCHMDKSWT